jgi:effector-binding domain-containing protein
MRIEQKPLLPAKPEDKCRMGGCMMAACYHIGPHETLDGAYKRLVKWAKDNHCALSEHFYERYVADYWLTSDTSRFVTALMAEVSSEGARAASAAAGE